MHTCVQHVQQQEAKSQRGLRFVNISRIIRRNLQDCNAFFTVPSRRQLFGDVPDSGLRATWSSLTWISGYGLDGESDAGMELRFSILALRCVP